MKHYPVSQQTADWFKIRAGMPTASCADKIISPARLKFSEQSVKYRNRLLAEWRSGTPFETEVHVWQMDQGIEREQEATEFFSLITGLQVEECGFYTNDSGTYGASPDRKVSDGSVLEVKAPLLETHIGYLLAGGLPIEHMLQVQMQILVVEVPHSWFLSYYPGEKEVLLKIYPDPKIQTALREALDAFCSQIAEAKRRLEELSK